MTDRHAEFLQDPEAHAAHLDQCAECRALAGRLDASVAADPIAMDPLPLANWEGAAYRSWGFVAAISVILAAMAIALCHMAGLSPVHVVTSDASFDEWRVLLGTMSGALRRASLGWQIAFGAAFVVVNTLLVFLLRKPTRGVDA